MEEVQCLLQSIQHKQVLAIQDDMMLLKEARDGRFSVKLLYRVLDQSNNVVFLIDLFGILGFPLRWVFSLEKPLGEKC